MEDKCLSYGCVLTALKGYERHDKSETGHRNCSFCPGCVNEFIRAQPAETKSLPGELGNEPKHAEHSHES